MYRSKLKLKDYTVAALNWTSHLNDETWMHLSLPVCAALLFNQSARLRH